MNTQQKTPLRNPSKMMSLSRLGSLHQCRLSFMRTLTRRMARENWNFSRPEFAVDDQGVGYAVYSAHTPNRTYSLVAFAHDLPDEMRSDRVIATAWDATFTLFDGMPSANDIERLSKNVPHQEDGKLRETELTLSRANRSVRLWQHVVDSLAAGHQPDIKQLESVGYLMRTTAVYGSGKFGAADRENYADRKEFKSPFQPELLTVYLIRTFVIDLVQHMAKVKGGETAVPLDTAIATQLGIGNSTGLGMAPFIINHPILFNNWIAAREEAISRVRSIGKASSAEIQCFRNVFARSQLSLSRWNSEHPIQVRKLQELREGMQQAETYLQEVDLNEQQPWNALLVWAEDTVGEETQETLASMILEPYGDLVDDLTDTMSDNDTTAGVIDGSMSINDVRGLITTSFGWAADRDWDAKENCARAWYVSEEKMEPRLGERFQEPISDYEQPLAPARDAISAYRAMMKWSQSETIATFLLAHPEHRHTVRRAQMSRNAPYSEIHDNTISAALLPIDMLRAKLAFFGALHFDPRSDRWVRICMYAGAPYPNSLTHQNADQWVYPKVN